MSLRIESGGDDSPLIILAEPISSVNHTTATANSTAYSHSIQHNATAVPSTVESKDLTTVIKDIYAEIKNMKQKVGTVSSATLDGTVPTQ